MTNMEDFLVLPYGVMRKAEISSVSRYLDEILIVSKSGVKFSVDFRTRQSLDAELKLLCEWLTSQNGGNYGLKGDD